MRRPKGLQQGNAPTLIMTVLRDGPRHGYDIAREVERRSEGLIKFNHGTLYSVLHALEREEFISSEWEQPTGERERRIYMLTSKGKTEVEKLLHTWNELTNAMRKVIEGTSNE